MNDKAKIVQQQQRIKALEETNNNLQRLIQELTTRTTTPCDVVKITKEEWSKNGIQYASNTRNIWVNYMTEDIYMIIPKAKDVKSIESPDKV